MNELPEINEIDISRQARALAWLRLTDYMLVVVCGFWAIGILTELVVSFSSSDMHGMLLPLLVMAALLGYAAYTGWRHVGVINPAVWGAYSILFPLLLLLSLYILWSNLDLFGSLDEMMEQSPVESAQQLGGLFMAAWVGIISLVGWIALAVLRNTEIASLDATVGQVLSQLATHAGIAAASTTRVKRINTPRGLLIGGAGVLILLIHLFAPLPDNEKLAEAYLRFSQQIMLVAFFLLVRARRYFQIDADSLLAVDKRPVILFLRSFDDDEKQKFASSQRALLDFSLETRLANHFFRFGPFVAVGSPKETVPQPGAARVLLKDDEWQGRVLGWIGEANLIIMYSGETHWVNWELRQVIDSGRATSLILMFPEIKGWRPSQRKKSIEARVEKIREVFRETPWMEELEAFADFKGLRAMLFRPDGSMVMVKSRSHSRDSYHLAALVAHEQLLAGDAAAPAGATEPYPPARHSIIFRGAVIAAFAVMLLAAYFLMAPDDNRSQFEAPETTPRFDRLTFMQNELYYGRGVTQEEARSIGESLVREQYFTDDQSSSVILGFSDGHYELGFVVDPDYLDVPLVLMEYGMIGSRVAHETLQGSRVAVILYDGNLDFLQKVPLTSIMQFGKGELYYSEPVDLQEAKAAGETLQQIGLFNNETGASVALTHENGAFQLRFVMDTSQANEPGMQSAFREISQQVANEVLGGEPLVFHLCDDLFRTVHSEHAAAIDEASGR
ncbi:MAG: hypothetical protein P8Z78_04025 [Gammaproteobacteria bacterium]|jgi:hypothetical protein